MTLKSRLAVFAGKIVLKLLRILKKSGSSYPGKIALRVYKHVLGDLAKDYETVIVTGTNGKTLTTALTVQVLQEVYPNILTNSTGSNMKQGIVSAFLSHRVGKREKKVAVLEVDEANLVYVVPYLQPKFIVVTNVFRDQLDRFGEIYTIYDKIISGAAKAPNATLLMNGDLPIFNDEKLVNKRVYFGFDHETDKEMMAHYNTDGILCLNCQKILHYRFITYGNQGKYYCPHCSFKRPALTYAIKKVEQLTLENSQFTIENESFNLQVAGLYNVYNALAAYSVARELNVPIDKIQSGFSKAQRVFGRQEVVHVDGKEVFINLIKNPIGFNQVVELLLLQEQAVSVFALLNSHYADGQDISWIWDGQFELLKQLDVQQLVVGGKRYKDLAFRLEVAGYDTQDIIEEENIAAIIDRIKQAPTDRVNVLASYTAMLEFRKELAQQGYVKGEFDA